MFVLGWIQQEDKAVAKQKSQQKLAF